MPQIQPLVSIVTISLNSEDHIEETIKSVLSQDYPNIEYWIIDGGSTDKTLEIVRGYEDRLHWISEPDKGISDAMNKGIELSNGEIIAHLHSDDTYLPGTISKVVNLFYDNPDTKWLFGNANCVDKKGRVRRGIIFFNRYSYKYLKKAQIIFHQTVFVKREIFDAIGLFEIKYKYAMDYDMWLRIGSLYEPLQVNDTFVNFRETGLSSVESLNALNEEYAIRRNLENKTLSKVTNYIGYVKRRCLFPLIKFKRKIQYYIAG